MRKRRRPPPTLRRILIEFAAIAALHLVLLHILARAHVLEHLLAPGPGSRLALALTATFFLLRLFLLLFGPGWLLARLWLWTTRSSDPVIRPAGSPEGPAPSAPRGDNGCDGAQPSIRGASFTKVESSPVKPAGEWPQKA